MRKRKALTRIIICCFCTLLSVAGRESLANESAATDAAVTNAKAIIETLKTHSFLELNFVLRHSYPLDNPH